MSTLGDLGERRIVREILPGYTEGIGDDCAVVEWQGGDLVATTDPVPEPAAKLIGGDPDCYWMGKLLVTINASDLAAAGAVPSAFLAAIEAPSDMLVADFRRLLEGIRDACALEGLRFVGGNLREAQRVGAVGTAIGRIDSGRPLTRGGASAGDLVVSVGAGGIFWRDALALRAGAAVDKRVSPVFSPRSQCKAMCELRRAGLVRAAMDNSDGLLASISQLAEANALSVVLDMDSFVSSAGNACEAFRTWCGWGDWNIVASVSPSHIESAKEVAQAWGSPITVLGSFEPACGAPVYLNSGGTRVAAPRLESERFARDSWFRNGIDAYVEALVGLPLPF